MDNSDLIATGAFFTACLSALYARWAWYESRRANDISTHAKRMEIYRAFDALRFSMLQKACSISHEDAGKFYFPCRESEFYFNADVYNKLQNYFEVCFELAELNRKKLARKLTGDSLVQLHKEQDDMLLKEATLSKELDILLKNDLKIAQR